MPIMEAAGIEPAWEYDRFMRREPRARRSLFWTAWAGLASVVLAAACGASHAQDAPLTARLDGILNRLTQGQRAGAVAFVQMRDEVWHGASGSRTAGQRVYAGDRFGIESVTKTFVAAVALQLVGEGRLSLDDTVERWLPRRLRNGSRITIRELLNHTSGLAPAMPTEFPPMRTQQSLLFPPGTSESYANLNYVVLGAIIEKVTGRRLDREVRNRIFQPLRLTGTSYGPTQGSSDAAPPAWLGAPEVRPGLVTGDVGIVSTAADLATFYSALIGGKILPKAELAAMKRTVGTGIDPRAGLGMFRSSLPCGAAWGHGGNDNGYSDQVLASPDGSTVVVVAENMLNETATSEAAAAMFCTAR